MYLIPEDYTPYIRTAIKEDILLGNTALMAQVELAAVAEMNSYLSGRYDTEKVFPPILPWNNAFAWEADDLVYDAGAIYKALASNTDTRPSTNVSQPTPVWAKEDPRNPIIVLRAVYIALYHAHKSLPSSQIPQLRIDDYDLSIKWLEKVAEGTLNPMLPEAVRPDTGVASWGSETRRQTRY
jgi:phage gp36-like protein